MSRSDSISSKDIKNKRLNIGLNQKEFAMILGLNDTSSRTVRGWEAGEHSPSPAKIKQIRALKDKPPFKDKRRKHDFTFIDLFAGIGGLRLPFQQQKGKCIFSSEWDKFSQKTYAANFGELPHGDITKITASSIPDHDILLAGFPCQAFSQAGLKKGFSDTRGTMFFEIQRILAAKRPKIFLLENVKQLKGHDKGRTLKVILETLEGKSVHEISNDIPMSNEARDALSQKLNYSVDYKILSGREFGIPQNRQRIFIVGFDRDYFGDEFDAKRDFSWPTSTHSTTSVSSILETDKSITLQHEISQKLLDGHKRRRKMHAKKGNGFGYCVFHKDSEYTNTLSARYYKDGSEILIQEDHIKRPRKLTARECARLQGFPEEFDIEAVSTGQMYKQFGNSVCVTVIEALAERIASTFKQFKKSS